jgi:hypothetical protein
MCDVISWFSSLYSFKFQLVPLHAGKLKPLVLKDNLEDKQAAKITEKAVSALSNLVGAVPVESS